MNTYGIIMLVVVVFNFIATLYMIFKERRKPEKIISWLLLFSFWPIVGFLLYVLIGSGLSWKNKRMLRRKNFYNDIYADFYRELESGKEYNLSAKSSKLMKFNMANGKSVPTFGNKVEYFIDGNKKIERLKEDIKKAKHSINLEYYIFGDDEIGKPVMELLIQKAKEGVVVNLIYDSVGCLKSKRKFFRQLKQAGGHVKEFFPPLFYIRLINLKMNYRNHRKIAVIDGKIGYVGGINIRKDHCSCEEKVAPWLDAHVRIEGQAVYSLQNEFLNFWQFCNKEPKTTNKYVEEGYFPKINSKGETIAQIVSSGPDTKQHEIRECMQKMLQLAEKEVVLQTPYFIPDEVFLNALKTALSSGVKVKLIIPGKPDKKMVYYATHSFAQEFLEMGGEVYMFDGFNHAKVMVVDDEFMSIGTANTDYRSFELNFEINSILYNKEIVKNYKKTLESIFAHSQKVEKSYYLKRSAWMAIKQMFFRLFSPLF